MQSASDDVSDDVSDSKDDSGLAYSSSGVDLEDNTVSISLRMAYVYVVFYRVGVVVRKLSSCLPALELVELLIHPNVSCTQN